MRREDIIINGKKQRYYFFKGKNEYEFRTLKLGTSKLSSFIRLSMGVDGSTFG